MPLPLIPRALDISTAEGSTLVTTGDAIFAASDSLRAVVDVFIDDLISDGGASLTPADERSTARIVVELLPSTQLSAPEAEGIRADTASASTAADERHRLDVDEQGIRIGAATPEGAHRGLTTLRQLIHAGGGVVPFLHVQDGPRFSWRGLALDVARTFHSPATVRGVIDMCSLYKLNVLHLHLTDNEGWRLEVPGRPALTEIGGAGARDGRSGGFYSTEEMSALVAYAAARFITIVPEVDIPGHSAAALRAYPELAARASQTTGTAADTLDPDNAATWALVDDVLDAVVAQFPESAYIHIGADEVFGMPADAYARFVARAADSVRARGKRVLGWQELSAGPITAEDAIQYWIDVTAEDIAPMLDALPAARRALLTDALQQSLADIPNALSAGARVLVSRATRAYFDAPHTGSSLDRAQAETLARVGHPLYPAVSLRAGVEWDPVADTRDIETASQLAGVEAAIWCETIADRDDLEFMLLPRLSGIGEKGWSAHPTEWDDYARRLAAQGSLWTRRGWNWYRSDEIGWMP